MDVKLDHGVTIHYIGVTYGQPGTQPFYGPQKYMLDLDGCVITSTNPFNCQPIPKPGGLHLNIDNGMFIPTTDTNAGQMFAPGGDPNLLGKLRHRHRLDPQNPLVPDGGLLPGEPQWADARPAQEADVGVRHRVAPRRYERRCPRLGLLPPPIRSSRPMWIDLHPLEWPRVQLLHHPRARCPGGDLLV